MIAEIRELPGYNRAWEIPRLYSGVDCLEVDGDTFQVYAGGCLFTWNWLKPKHWTAQAFDLQGEGATAEEGLRELTGVPASWLPCLTDTGVTVQVGTRSLSFERSCGLWSAKYVASPKLREAVFILLRKDVETAQENIAVALAT